MNKIIALIKHYTGYGKDVDEACQWIDELVKERDSLRAALGQPEQSAPGAGAVSLSLTRDDVLRIAKDAGFKVSVDGYDKLQAWAGVAHNVTDELMRFATLVTAHQVAPTAEQEPVAEVRDGGMSGIRIAPLVLWEKLPDGTKLYTAQPAPQAVAAPDAASQPKPSEANNFCSTCGKRTPPESIHTCTPPSDGMAAGRQAKPLTDNEMWAAAVLWAGTEEVGYSKHGHTGIVCRTPEEIGDIFRAILSRQEKPE